MKHRKITYSASVLNKDRENQTMFWFQDGKMIHGKDVDYSKQVSSSKEFRTLKKLMTFMRWLDATHPDTYILLNEMRDGNASSVIIPMGDDWKEWIRKYKNETEEILEISNE